MAYKDAVQTNLFRNKFVAKLNAIKILRQGDEAMDFREMIEAGQAKFESKVEFASAVEQHPNAVLDALKKKRGLPNKSCVKLAQILGIEELKVIAAKEEWMAKTEEDKEFWHPLANAAGIAAISVAIVTSFVLPSPAQAAQHKGLAESPLCIM